MKKIYKQQLLKKAVYRMALFLGVLLWGSISSFAQSYDLPIQGGDVVRCGAGELTLEVEWSGESLDPNNVKWYTEPFYGTPIATGLSYNTGYIEFTQTFFVDYIGDGGCGQCDRLMIRAVIENQTITPDVIYSSENFCNSADTWFTPSIVGSNAGVFSVNPDLGVANFDTSDGSFNPHNLASGTYEVTYQPVAITGCNSNSVIISLTVTDAPVVPTISYANSAYCVDEGTVTIANQTGASGGTYSAVPNGLAINSANGSITLASSVEGEYMVSYVVPAGGGCDPVSATATIRVDAASVGGEVIAESSIISSGTGTSLSLTNYLGAIQWQSSSDNLNFTNLSDETSATLSTGNLTETTYYRAVVTNGVCGFTYSDTAMVTVSAASIAGTASATPSEICDGATSLLELTGYTGNIQWQNNETGAFVDIPGATSDSYTTASLSITTPGTDRIVKYRAVVTEGLSAPDISNELSITIRPNPQPGIVLGDEICSASDGTVTVFDYLGDVVQWQSSTTEGGAYSDISGATSASYTETGMTTTTYYRAAISNGPCNVIYTDPVAILVYPPSIAGTATTSQDQICTGGTADITLTGYTGSVTWEYQAPGGEWTYAGGSDAFTTNALTELGTHKYQATVKSGNCVEALSSVVSIEVVPQPSWTNYTAPIGTITYGESVSFDVDVADGLGGTITWTRSTTSGGAGETVSSPDTPGAVGTYYYRPTFTPTGENCSLADGTEYTVVVDQKELTVNNAIVTTKTYDGDTDADITGATLAGLVLGDTEDVDVSLDNDASGTFASANAGTHSVTTSMTISGAKAGNYTLAQPSLSGEITQLQLTADTPSLNTSKVYDGNTTAAVTAGSLTNIVGADEVSINTTTATYDDKNVGTNKTITVTYTIAGAQANNYLAPVDYEATTGEISALQLTASDPAITKSKVYDGNTTANVTDAGSLTNVVSSENVTISSTTANYDNADIGTGKTISVVYTIGGDDAGNYSAPNNFSVTDGVISEPIIQVLSTSGSITGAAYTTLKAAYDKINDGSHQGDITIKIYQSISDEDATATLNQSGVGSANYTSITIIAANNISVSGAASPLLILGSN
nr:YDG domain-containing protein [uncultured Draconibacterium sp.]